MKVLSENARLLESSLEVSGGTSKSDDYLHSVRGSSVTRSLTPTQCLPRKTLSSSSEYAMKVTSSENSEPPLITSPVSDRNRVQVSGAAISLQTISSHGVQSEISTFDFFMQIVRASVGTGVLALPSAVGYAGLVFGMVGIILTSLITIHCVHLLVECVFFLRKRHNLSDFYIDYGSAVKCSFLFGTRSAQKFRWLSAVSDISVVVVQFGGSIVYLTFVADSIQIVVVHFQPDLELLFVVYLSIAAILILPFTFIRSIGVLSVISSVGNVFMIVSMVLVFVYCVQDIPPIEDYPLITNIQKIPMFFGIAIFAFESINVVLPTETALKDKRNLLGICGLLSASYYIVLIIYVAVAFYGYVKFGENIEGALTYSLPFSPWYIGMVKPLYALLIAMSFGIQFYVLIDLVWLTYTSWTPRRFHRIWLQNLFRLTLFLVAFGVAALVPFIDAVISLSGALAGSMVCIIIPPFIYTVLFWDHSYEFSCFKLVVVKNLLIIAFGLFGMGIGTYTSILEIYNRLK